MVDWLFEEEKIMATFGKTDIGLDTVLVDATDTIRGSIYTCPSDGTLTGGSIYFDPDGNGDAKMLVYRHSDLALIAESAAESFLQTDAADWYNFTFAGESVVNGVVYLLCIFKEIQATLYRTNNAEVNAYHEADDAYNAAPDPLVVDAHRDHLMSIYATYTPTAPEEGGLRMTLSLKGHMGYDLKTRGGKARRRTG